MINIAPLSSRRFFRLTLGVLMMAALDTISQNCRRKKEARAITFPAFTPLSSISHQINRVSRLDLVIFFIPGVLVPARHCHLAGLRRPTSSADVSLADLSLTYTFCPTILGAHYTVSASIPDVWVNVKAKVSVNPRLFPLVLPARSKTVQDGTNGLSDIFLVPFALNWTVGDLQINPQFSWPRQRALIRRVYWLMRAKIIGCLIGSWV